jgi:hypothetical protein
VAVDLYYLLLRSRWTIAWTTILLSPEKISVCFHQTLTRGKGRHHFLFRSPQSTSAFFTICFSQ